MIPWATLKFIWLLLFVTSYAQLQDCYLTNDKNMIIVYKNNSYCLNSLRFPRKQVFCVPQDKFVSLFVERWPHWSMHEWRGSELGDTKGQCSTPNSAKNRILTIHNYLSRGNLYDDLLMIKTMFWFIYICYWLMVNIFW